MRPAKLYLEIFVSFVLAIIVSETMIFFLFTDSERRIIGYKMEQNTLIKVQMLKKLADAHLSAPENMDPADGYKLQKTLSSVASIYDALIWIETNEGIPLQPPAGGDIPEDLHLLDTPARTDLPDGIRLYNNVAVSSQVYASIPLEPRTGERLTLYIVYNVHLPPHHKWQFLLGLFIIGTVVALLIIPVSKFITDRVKALKESALRIAEGELSHRVSIKAHDEIGDLAIAFNQMAERLERMIVGGKELTANISHELRTPLTRIRISQEILMARLEKIDADRCDRYLNEIRENVEELDTLIGRILELSKLDIHEVKPNYEQFSPARLIEEITEKLAPVISHKQLTVKKDLPPSPPVTGDRMALTMALSNILDNAAKFCPEKGTIHLGMALNGNAYSIRVANTYDKLPIKDLEKIFEPFYRSRKSNASGTGLGLSIAAKIAKKHGGNIEAFNGYNGFEIRLELPAGVGGTTQRA
jgi:two-component system sensor histidine kinase CpxA